MKKRLFALILVLAMAVCALPVGYAASPVSGTCGPGMRWTLDGGTLTVSGSGDMVWHYTCPWDNYRTQIRSVVIEKGVTAICDNAFEGCTALTEVSLPISLKRIGSHAFSGCSALEEVLIPGSVSQIGTGAFARCTGLTSLTVGEGDTAIGDFAFMYCSALTKTVLSEGLTRIGEGAFYGCSGLTGLTLPESVTEIGYEAFSSCSALTEIRIPAGTGSVSPFAFIGCPGLTRIEVADGNPSYRDLDGVLFNAEGTALLRFPGGRGGSYAVPGGVTRIRFYAFQGCEGLTEVTLPDSVTDIGESAFADCTGLTSMTLPSGITQIKDGVFSCCTGLTRISIPNGVSRIGIEAFYGCSSLPEITLPDSVRSIRYDAFLGCWGLKQIIFEGSAPEIGETAFDGVTATVCYPAGDPSWTEDRRQDYCGTLNWVSYGSRATFSDVPEGSWFNPQIQWAVSNGITNGMGDGTFAPDATCTRNQVVTFLWRAMGSPEPKTTNNPFVDVKQTDYFYKPVLWAVENGITNGMDETHFGSNEKCTRAQVVTFLHRAAGKPDPASTANPFTDVGQAYYTTPVLWAVGEGITTGMGDGTFGTESTCTRAQIVTFLYRYCE